jgi:heptosyltransferase I
MQIDRLLIVRLGSLGDVVHAIPAVKLLRRAFPAAQLHWAIEERWSELVRGTECSRRPLLDGVHFINTRVWRKAPVSDGTWREVLDRFRVLRAVHFDAAVDFQGLVKSAVVTAISGARIRYGFERPREALANLFYTRTVEVTATHVVDQNIELARVIAPHATHSAEFDLPHDPVAESWCDAYLAGNTITQFALLSPGGGWKAKLWRAENYAEVARALGSIGLSSIINYGPGEDALAKTITDASGGAATPLRCSLAELIALTRRASIFIGGDTGPMHLAAALGIRVVALFGPTDPARNGPYGGRSIVLRSPLSATSYSHSTQSDEGLKQISAADVIDAVHQLLGTAR